MPKMQVANVMLALAGHKGNTIPKYQVTAAEIAVLRIIHGNESVTDVEPTGEVERSHRDELARLRERYGRMEGESFQSPAVNSLFPGAAARVFERLDELEIPAEFYKADRRMTPEQEAREARLNEPQNDATDANAVVTDQGAASEAADDIGEINDSHAANDTDAAGTAQTDGDKLFG